MATTIEIYKDKSGDHRWRIKGANGRTMADGAEGYNRREGAVSALLRIITDLKFGRTKIRVTAKGGNPELMQRDKDALKQAVSMGT